MEKEDPNLARLREAFLKNPGINPKTGRKIIIGGDTYQKLMVEFKIPKTNQLRTIGQTQPITQPIITITQPVTKPITKAIMVPNIPKPVIRNKLQYLYDLETNNYIDQAIMDNIINKKIEILPNHLLNLFEWLYEIRRLLRLNISVFGYTCTLIFITLRDTTEKTALQLLGIVCMYCATLFLEDDMAPVIDYLYLADGKYDGQQFYQGLVKLFNRVNGTMIYPSPILFIDNKVSTEKTPTDNDIIITLTSLTSTMISLTAYKPSLIAETCTYMITGKVDNYTKEEMGHICVEIVKILKAYARSNLKIFRPRAELVLSRIKYPCSLEVIKTTAPLKAGEKFELGDIITGKILGEGAYGQVTKITRKTCGLDYVIKETTELQNTIDSALIEIGILTLLKGEPNIIYMCGYQYQVQKTDIILEIMDGSLFNFYMKLKFNKFPKYFKQILEGVKQCHDHDLIHRDIKLENILYDIKTDTMKIADFGLSISFQSSRVVNKVYLANTITYRPPECLMFDSYNYEQAIDIWATGCVFYTLIDKRLIVKNWLSNQTVLDDIFALLGTPSTKTWPELANLKLSSTIVIKQYPGIIPTLKRTLAPHANLILDLLTINPNTRPTVYDVLDKYF